MGADPNALLQKADKALSGAGSGFSFFGGRSDKYQDAADLYIQAANAFRVSNQSEPAGRAFEKAAQIQQKNINEPDDAANSLVEAFKCYKKVQPENAARCLQPAITQFTARGNFRRGATHMQSLAELYEVELGDQKRAIDSYRTAAGWFEQDNAEALANKLFQKVADLAALDEDYPTAIQNYERIAKSAAANNLMRWSVKDFFLKAGICLLAQGDVVATSRGFESYREIDPGFASTREHQLLVDLSEAVDGGDAEQFSDKLFEYDRMSKLDRWKTTLLLRVKNKIEAQEEDFS